MRINTIFIIAVNIIIAIFFISIKIVDYLISNNWYVGIVIFMNLLIVILCIILHKTLNKINDED